MKEIPLASGKGVMLVDDEDYNMLSKYSWSKLSRHDGATAYAISRTSRKSLGGRKSVLMHRLIMHPGPSQEIDHIDGNGLNNCKSNLRVCSHSENMQNGRVTKRFGSSRFKGVSYTTQSSKHWLAHIGDDHIGYFTTQEEAAIAYNAEAQKRYKTFARLNEV
jgi:hypothetical protein